MNNLFFYLVFFTLLCYTHLDAKPAQTDSNSTALKYHGNQTEVDGDLQKQNQQELVQEMAIDQNVSDVKTNVPPDGADGGGGGDGNDVAGNVINGPKTVDDSMHGVMMHGDKSPGKDHSHEDIGSENVVATNIKAGPQDIEQQMHGVLMHGDDAPGKDHSHEHGKLQNVVATNSKAGPQDIEQQMHGVLMHGDSQAGILHHTKDQRAINPKFRGQYNVQNYEEYLHGVIMHGDSEPGKDHHSHSGEDKNTDDNKKKEEGIANNPMDYEEYLHGVLMHNDAKPGESYEHEDAKKFHKIRKSDQPVGPLDADELMHGILMHNDASSGYKHHEHEEKKKVDPLSQPGSVLAPDIEALDKSLSNNKALEGPSFAKRKIKVKDGKDLEEKVKPVEESRISGYLYSIYKTIHDMKEKYFNRGKNNDNNNNNHNMAGKGTVYSESRGGRNQKIEKASTEGVGVITVEEARRHLSPTHEHKSDDMRSDLDIIGNTAPLRMNYRHKGKKHKHDEG